MSPEEIPPVSPDPPARPPTGTPTKVIRSEDIFEGQRIVFIEHAGSMYRLLITARGKLILQK